MKRSNRLVLLIGIFLALVAFVLIVMTLGNDAGRTAGPTAAPTTGKVVVATQDIALGELIQADQVDLKEIPLPVPAGAYADTSLVIGQTARATVTAGQLITSTALTGSEGLIGDIEVPAGRVAMSVKVNQVSGVGTVIKTGDYVDAIVAFNIVPTYADPDTGLPKAFEVEAGPSVKALLQGMQVLGTLLPTPATPAQPTPTPAPSASAAPQQGQSTSLNDQEQVVVLAVTLQQAEVLNYSQISGITGPNGITLVLRSAKDYVDANNQPSIPPDTLTTGVILSILIDQYGVLPPAFNPVPAPSPAN